MPKPAPKNAVVKVRSTVYKALGSHPVLKASEMLQTESVTGGLIAYPYSPTILKAINEAHHDRCIAIKAATTVGIGYTFFTPGTESEVAFAPPGNPNESFTSVMMGTALDWEKTGDAYLEVVRDRTKTISELYWLPTETMWKKKLATDKKHQGYRQRIGTKSVDYHPFGTIDPEGKISEVIHIRMPNAESRHYGTPDWIGCLGDVILSNNAIEYNAQFFANNAIPDWCVTIIGASLTNEVKTDIKGFFETNLKGVSNSRKVLLLEIAKKTGVEIKWEQLSDKMKDGDFIKLLGSCRDRILSCHGVPPRLAGVVVSGQLGGGGEAQEQMKIFRAITSDPRKKLWENELNRTLFEELGVAIKFNPLQIFDDDDTGTSPLVVAGGMSEEKMNMIGKSLNQIKAALLT